MVEASLAVGAACVADELTDVSTVTGKVSPVAGGTVPQVLLPGPERAVSSSVLFAVACAQGAAGRLQGLVCALPRFVHIG